MNVFSCSSSGKEQTTITMPPIETKMEKMREVHTQLLIWPRVVTKIIITCIYMNIYV